MGTEERVLLVIRENLEHVGEAKIGPDSELQKDLHIDSLNALTIIFGLEKEFRVTLHESSLSGCITVHDVAASLDRACALAGGGPR